MKSVLFAVFFLVSLCALNAFAQHVPFCKDGDGDGYVKVVAGCVVPQGAKLDKSGDVLDDCDDVHSNINPGEDEVWNDGIDNDCHTDPWDAQGPGTPSGGAKGDRNTLGEAALKRFEMGIGTSIPPKSAKELKLRKQINACKTPNCTVDYVGGKFKTQAGWRFVDVDCDGINEVVADSYSPTLADQEKCKKAAAKAAAITVAVRKATAKKAAPPAPAAPLPGAAAPAVNPAAPAPKAAPATKGARARADNSAAAIAKAQATADEAKRLATDVSTTVDGLGVTVKGQGEHLTALDKALAEQKAAIEAETKRAKAAEDAIDTKAQAATDLAGEAKVAAEEAKQEILEQKTKGGFLEGYAGGGFIVQRDFDVTPKGAKKAVLVRDQFAGAAELGANLGFETKGSRFNLFGAFSPNWDLGDVSMGATGGAEVTWRLGGSQSYLGVHGLYQRHHAGGNVVYTNAVGNAFGGGATFVFRGADQAHLGIQARLTAAWETFGTDVHRKDIQDGPVIRLMIDVLAGYSLASN